MSEAFKLDGAQPVMVPIKLETVQAITQMLVVDLSEGEFEHEYEYRKVESILNECKKALHEALESVRNAGGKGASQPEKIDPRLKAIAEHYGFDAQTEKAIEEMAELIVAIKNLKKIDGNEADYLVNFVEELADVKIMIEQLCYLNDKDMPEECDLKTKDEIEFKIKRQLKRIEEEKEERE